MPHAPVLTQVLNEAADIARATDQRLTSGHALLAFFTVHNGAERFLRERGLDEDSVLDLVEGPMKEPPDTLVEIVAHAEQIAAGSGAREIDCLHLLYAMTRAKGSAALALLEKSGEPVGALSRKVLSIVNGARPVWVGDEARRATRPAPKQARAELGRSELPRPGMSSAIRWSPPVIERKLLPQKRGVSTTGRTVEPLPMEERASPVAATPPAQTPAAVPVAVAAPAAPPEKKTSGEDPAAEWLLHAGEYPWLTSLGRNLSAAAARGEIDHLAGRETEIETIIDILGKRRANNPCLIGEPGVGKTAVVEGLALALLDRSPDRIIVELDVGSLLIGTHLRGSFSEKLQGLKEEVKRARRVIVFFDELHTLVGAGSTGDGAQDAANELKSALARGEFPCIGATTLDEFKKHVEPDAALERRFYPVLIKEPSTEQALAMLRHVIPSYEEHHGIVYTDEALRAAVEMSSRYIVERRLPDKAIALLDLAGSRAARAAATSVEIEDVARLIAEQAEIPIERVMSSDRERLLGLESYLAREIVGHREALRRIADVIRRNAAGFGSKRPQGSFLLLGPTGGGKTETAKVLARFLHGSEEALLRFDLSEFSEPHSVARLVGAPPGYVGHDAGGQLTDSVRKRPARVILLDEIEKAHREVLQLFLQVLDEGRLTDTHGRTVSFAETIVIMTSNLGADAAHGNGRPIGFGAPDSTPGAAGSGVDARITSAAQERLPPELWARIDERLVFPPLGVEEVREIARKLAEASSARLMRERGIRYDLDDRAVDFLVAQGGFDVRLGARPMRQVLSRIVEAPIAARILEGRLHADERVLVSTTERGTLSFLVGEDRTSLSQRPAR